MNTKGKFIVFEGIDGSGKSTQMKLLSQYLAGRSVPNICTHEPTDSPFGRLVHACMKGSVDTGEHTIAAMFVADRLDHIENPVYGMKKTLDEGTTVLCDRFYLSSFAYNGGQTDLDWVISINEPAMKALRPDLTIFLDLSAEEGMERVLRRGELDRYESLEKQRKIRERYFELFRLFDGERIRIVKSEAEKERTQDAIRRAVEEELGI